MVRHYRGAQTRLWAAFNPGAPTHRSGVDQFAHPTTTKKWSRFVPLTSSQVGNATGVLLGFNKTNTLNSAVLIDLPGTARRNHNPCLICAGAPGYGKSYAAKRLVRSEIQRGSQAFIIDPGTEWATALGDRPGTAVIDMAGAGFGCDPLRIFPHQLAGGYWLDYLLPMTGIDARSVAAARLRSLLAPDSRRRLGLTSTAALIAHLADLDDDDLRPVLVTLQSWASHDFTQAIFDPTLPVPDLTALDAAIWLTGSLDLPTAQEMSSPHLYRSLSERKLASVAIYGMLVRLARVSFFANRQRFGLIVLEEAGALLNSRAGADDAHLISRRARKHYTGMVIITQDPIADLELMGDQFITQKLIMPFEDDELARRVVPSTGIRLQDYPDIEEYFLARTPADQLRDPGAFVQRCNRLRRRAPRRQAGIRLLRRRVSPRRTDPRRRRTRPGGARRVRHHARRRVTATQRGGRTARLPAGHPPDPAPLPDPLAHHECRGAVVGDRRPAGACLHHGRCDELDRNHRQPRRPARRLLPVHGEHERSYHRSRARRRCRPVQLDGLAEPRRHHRHHPPIGRGLAASPSRALHRHAHRGAVAAALRDVLDVAVLAGNVVSAAVRDHSPAHGRPVGVPDLPGPGDLGGRLPHPVAPASGPRLGNHPEQLHDRHHRLGPHP